jgi:uncharacterized sodium:solute symporter family permease YidK
MAAKNILHGRAGCVMAALLKLVPVFLMVVPGMAARVLMTERGLGNGNGNINGNGGEEPMPIQSPPPSSSSSSSSPSASYVDVDVQGLSQEQSDRAYPWLIMNVMPMHWYVGTVPVYTNAIETTR